MNRTEWKVYTQTGSGGSWEESDPIYACNENLERSKAGTLIQTKLANGGNAYSSPEVKFNYEPFTMVFLAIEEGDSFIDTINDYIDNATLVKVEDHNGGEMIGIFSGISQVWLSGIDDCYDFQVTFARMV
jgi:hypothetical protein